MFWSHIVTFVSVERSISFTNPWQIHMLHELKRVHCRPFFSSIDISAPARFHSSLSSCHPNNVHLLDTNFGVLWSTEWKEQSYGEKELLCVRLLDVFNITGQCEKADNRWLIVIQFRISKSWTLFTFFFSGIKSRCKKRNCKKLKWSFSMANLMPRRRASSGPCWPVCVIRTLITRCGFYESSVNFHVSLFELHEQSSSLSLSLL